MYGWFMQKKNVFISMVFITLAFGCASSPPEGDEFGTGLCDCAKQAQGDRKVMNECLAELSKSAIPFFQENGRDSNILRRDWKRKMFESATECRDELQRLGFNIEAIKENWTKKR